MLTSSQLSLYGRRWGRTCSSNGWKSVGGRVACDETASAARSDLHRQVWRLAHLKAGDRPVSVEDLRHAVTALAAGAFVSTKDLTNREFDRLLCLIGSGRRRGRPELRGLLVDPEDLESRLLWENPEADDASRYAWFIEHECSPEYVERIVKERFGRANWRALEGRELLQLWFTLKSRPNARLRRSKMPL